jgi:hypothetical protein
VVVERSVQIMRSGHHGSHMRGAGRRECMKQEIEEQQAEEGRWGRVVEKRSPWLGCRGEFVTGRPAATYPIVFVGTSDISVSGIRVLVL